MICFRLVNSSKLLAGVCRNKIIIQKINGRLALLTTDVTPCAFNGCTGLRQLHTEKELDSESEVYTGPLTRQVRTVKLFSLLTSMSGIFAQPVIMAKSVELGAGTGTLAFACCFVGFFTFGTPLLLHWITKKYITSIVYDPKDDAYTATTYTLFLGKKEVYFKPGEAKVPEIPGMFTTMTVRGIPLFADSRFFTDLEHYKKIMGYDKPIDFKFDEIQTKK